jgi:hypothetical protein
MVENKRLKSDSFYFSVFFQLLPNRRPDVPGNRVRRLVKKIMFDIDGIFYGTIEIVLNGKKVS